MTQTTELSAHADKDEVLAARKACGHGETQALAASRVHLKERTWQDYERGERKMLRAVLELYVIKTARLRKKAVEAAAKAHKSAHS